MPDRLTRSRALVGALNVGGALPLLAQSAPLSRSNTAPVNLCALPQGAQVVAILVTSPTGSNAGTTATISIGPTGSVTAWLNAVSVLGAAGAGQLWPSAVIPTPLTGETTVQGEYTESGAASTAGGPWTITILYTL